MACGSKQNKRFLKAKQLWWCEIRLKFKLNFSIQRIISFSAVYCLWNALTCPQLHSFNAAHSPVIKDDSIEHSQWSLGFSLSLSRSHYIYMVETISDTAVRYCDKLFGIKWIFGMKYPSHYDTWEADVSNNAYKMAFKNTLIASRGMYIN